MQAEAEGHHSRRHRILHKVGEAVNGIFGESEHHTDGTESHSSSNSLKIAAGLLHSYNTRTDSKGGLTDQILVAVESLFAGGLEMNADFVQKAEAIVKSLLSTFANQSMGGVHADDNSTTGKLAQAARGMAMGVLAKKVVGDLLVGNKLGSTVSGSKTDSIKKLLVGVLTNQVARGESQAAGLESDSKLGSLMSKAKSLAKGLIAEKASEGLFNAQTGGEGGFLDQVKIFAEEMLAAKSTQSVLGGDARLSSEAKQVIYPIKLI